MNQAQYTEIIKQLLMKVKTMSRILAAAVEAVRNTFTTDSPTTRFLDKTHTDVRRNSRLWGI
jgi:hypothetical protein